jgi:hypothetical protein
MEVHLVKGDYGCFVFVRLYHTVSTTNHASAEPMNPTSIH